MVGIKEFQEAIHATAKAKGWWDEPRTFGEIIALCHSELSEALEEYRNNKEINKMYYPCKPTTGFNCRKPEGVPSELADCIIRILDACEYFGIDMEQAINLKMEYNVTREHRHGGKKI